MNNQKELQIIRVEDIMINPENPRQNEVQLTIPEMGEELIMRQLIRDRETANKMFDLVKSIYESGQAVRLARSAGSYGAGVWSDFHSGGN